MTTEAGPGSSRPDTPPPAAPSVPPPPRHPTNSGAPPGAWQPPARWPPPVAWSPPPEASGSPSPGRGAGPPALAALVVGLSLLAVAVVASAVVLAGVSARESAERETRRVVALEVDALGAELDAWWDAALSDLVDDVPEPRLAAGGGALRCDGERIVVDDDLVDNAWVSTCREGLTVAYDPALFASDTLELEMTMAHEWGHVVQFATTATSVVERTGEAAIDIELQADCFAGAWYGDARPDGPVNLALRSVRRTGDLPDTPRDAPDAHGTPDERADAFLDGHRGGVEACLP